MKAEVKRLIEARQARDRVRASMPAIVKAVLNDRVDEYLTKLIK